MKKNLDAWNHFQQCKDPVCSDVPTTDSSALDGPRPPVDKHSEIVQVRSFVSIAHVNDLTMMFLKHLKELKKAHRKLTKEYAQQDRVR